MKKIIISFLIILVFTKTSFGSDTLLVNTKQPDKHRIILYGGQYYLKLILTQDQSYASLYTLNVVGGTYEVKNKTIIFKDPAPMVDTIKTKYYVWPPRRTGPDYTFDLDEMVYTMFGIKIKIDGMRSINYVVGTGQILSDNTLKLGKLKYKIISK